MSYDQDVRFNSGRWVPHVTVLQVIEIYRQFKPYDPTGINQWFTFGSTELVSFV